MAEKKIDNKANWMVSNSAKLDCRTKQHTQFGVSASNCSRDMARTKSWRKKKKEKRMNATIPYSVPTGIVNNNNNNNNNNDNNETGSRSPCMRPWSDPPTFCAIERGEKHTNNID